MLRLFVYERFYRHPLLQFVDLCSVSNVSILLFDEPSHGYYIHGRSVHSYADTDMAELFHQLKKEEVGGLFQWKDEEIELKMVGTGIGLIRAIKNRVM